MIETAESRKQRLRKAAARIDYGKRRQIPPSLTWDDLDAMTQRIFRASVLGDGSIVKPSAGRHHYYTETKKLDHREYLLWKQGLVRPEFRTLLYERTSDVTHPRCTWETGVSQVFTKLRGQFYRDDRIGYKSIISDWTIKQLDLFDLLIWLLDDGRNNMRNGYPNLEICVERWEWDRDSLYRLCGLLNLKYGLHLYVRPRQPHINRINNVVIPSKDRDYLLPIWWEFADEHKLPECMRYKIPKYNPPQKGSRRLNWEENFGTDSAGLKCIVVDMERAELAKVTHTMWRNGFSLSQVGQYIKDNGQKITPRYLLGVWMRLGLAVNDRLIPGDPK
jgi:hypothetical protein